MSHSHHRKKFPVDTNSLQDECIRVQKVYDWVTDALTVEEKIQFTSEQIKKIEHAMENPNRRPLRIVCHAPKTGHLIGLHYSDDHDDRGVLCEQVGDKRDVTVPVNGRFTTAQLVDLLFTADIKVSVVDRHGHEVTRLNCTASAFEPFVLCFPDGTDLFCKITKVICKIPSGTVMLNCPAPESFTLQVTFCVDIQVESEVKLEVLAKFCSPRDNDIEAPEGIAEQCPDIVFPEQCPDIFPRQNCDCSASAEASGMTAPDATEKGQIGIFADICPNCSLVDSEFSVTFNDTDTTDGLDDVFFRAVEFDQSTLVCETFKGDGLILKISGVGRAKHGRMLDFNLALVNSPHGDKFQVQLFDKRGKKEFDSGIVDVTDGRVSVEDCVTFEDLKYHKVP